MNWPKRIVDDDGGDECDRKASLLIASMRDANVTSQITERRVYRAVMARQLPFAPRPKFRLLIIVIVTLAGTAAGAAVGYNMSRVADAPVQPTLARAPRADVAVPRVAVNEPKLAVVYDVVPERPLPPKVRPGPRSRTSDPLAHNKSTDKSAASEMAAAELLLQATTALRRSKAPKDAIRSVELYLREWPTGPLAEEAFGLALEAAGMLHPDERHKWARAYLVRYPAGRFVNLARGLLATPGEPVNQSP